MRLLIDIQIIRCRYKLNVNCSKLVLPLKKDSKNQIKCIKMQSYPLKND